MIKSPLQHSIVAFALAALLCTVPSVAFCEDIDTDPQADDLQKQVERTAAAYDEAVIAAEKAGKALDENGSRILELEALIPAQQAKSDAAARELYKFQQQSPDVIDLLLSSNDFFDLLANLEYISRITDANVSEIARLNSLKAELEEQRVALEQAKSEADAGAAEAEHALAAAQEARMEAQRRAREAARQAAEANAAAAAAARQDAPQETVPAPTASTETVDAGAEAVEAVSDDADWSSDEASFVESWAGRIDAYLSGSPLAGQGRTFAQAAWDYGVDPRWSPAISYTESSLGAACFLPHNAWGWGSASWDSWEEAINDHVRGLARGYGYTISMDAANKYCPPSAKHWYDTTLAQMNKI